MPRQKSRLVPTVDRCPEEEPPPRQRKMTEVATNLCLTVRQCYVSTYDKDRCCGAFAHTEEEAGNVRFVRVHNHPDAKLLIAPGRTGFGPTDLALDHTY